MAGGGYSLGKAIGSDIPLEHLDSSYIEICRNAEELEKIIKILRSGVEGRYPHLEISAEKRLYELKPNSNIFLREKSSPPVTSDDTQDILDDLETWKNSLSEQEQCLLNGVGVQEETLPPVRATNVTIGRIPQPVENMDSPAKVTPCVTLDHSEMDGLAEKEKLKGNEAFRSGDYSEAVEYYGKSIDLKPSLQAYNNRALAYLKLKLFQQALRDCEQVIKISPTDTKGLYRKACAYDGLGRLAEAKECLGDVLVGEPGNKKAIELLETLNRKICKQQEKQKQNAKLKGKKVVIKEIDGAKGTSPVPPKVEQASGTPPEVDQHVDTPPKVDQHMDTPPKVDQHVDTPPKVDQHVDTPPKVDQHVDTPPKVDQHVDTPPKVDQHVDTPPKVDQHVDTPSKVDQHVDTPPKVDQHVDTPFCPVPEEVGKLRTEGTNYYKQGQFSKAIEFYTSALAQLQPDSDVHRSVFCTLLTNRAAGWLKIGNCRECIEDCTESIRLQSDNVRAYVRRAEAYETLEKYVDAIGDYEQALRIVPYMDQIRNAANRVKATLTALHGPQWKAITTTNIPETSVPEEPETSVPREPETSAPEEPETSVPEEPETSVPEETETSVPEEPETSVPEEPETSVPEEPETSVPEEPETSVPEEPETSVPEEPETSVPEEPETSVPKEPETSVPEEPETSIPEEPETSVPEEPETSVPEEPETSALEEPETSVPEEPETSVPEEPETSVPEEPETSVPEEPEMSVPEEPEMSVPEEPEMSVHEEPEMSVPEEPETSVPEEPETSVHEEPETSVPEEPKTSLSETATPNISESQTSRTNEVAVKTSEDIFEEFRVKGNSLVKVSEFEKALHCYSQCIKNCPANATGYTNRALCFLKLNRPGLAEEDCVKALEIDKKNVKALYRRALARKGLKKYSESAKDLCQLLQMDPGNAAAKGELEVVKDLWRKDLKAPQRTSQAADSSAASRRSSRKRNKAKKKKIVIEEVTSTEPALQSTLAGGNGTGDISSSKASLRDTFTGDTSASDTSPRDTSTRDTSSGVTVPRESFLVETSTRDASADGTSPRDTTIIEKFNETLSPYVFLHTWNSIPRLSPPARYAELLNNIDIQQLPNIVSNKLDGEMLVSIISAARYLLTAGQPDTAYNVLLYASHCERFGTVAMFLSKQERAVCKEVITQLHNTRKTQDIQELVTSYSIN